MTNDTKTKGVRFDPDQLARIIADANARGESFSEWLRIACEQRLQGGQSGTRPRRARDVVQKKPQPFNQDERRFVTSSRASPRRHAANCSCMTCVPPKG